MKSLPKKLKEGYRKALDDPKLLSLEEDIATLEMRLTELFEDLGNSEPPAWGEALAYLDSFQRDGNDSDFEKLAEILRNGADSARSQKRLWAEIKDVMNLKARLSATDHKRQVDIGIMITAVEANTLMNRIIDVTRAEIFGQISDMGLARKVMGNIAQKLIPVLAPQEDKEIPEQESKRGVPAPREIIENKEINTETIENEREERQEKSNDDTGMD